MFNVACFCLNIELITGHGLPVDELFVKYSWNSFLHSQVEQCVFMVLNDPPTQGEDKAGVVSSLVVSISASSEANVASVVADITLEVVRDSADDTAVTMPQEPTDDVMTPPDTSTDEKETETPKKTEAKVASVPPPFTKSAPACLEVPTSGDDKNVSSSVMYPYNSEEEDDDDDDDLSDNFNFLARSGLMKTDVTVDDSHRTDSKDTKSESCPEAASAQPLSPTKSDLEEKR
ncbi:hypothetical protein NP493_1352g00019 [Ridgeia piscesae]|uniref:Uncharacterized protein n=1 Tax=Ridgeia piscesae TaxID=27915 RepID=A0AAD9K678_RIDPI|nr:hypothetical protein NP493_1352g00019 [Ridgeia piscesae]